MSTIDILHRVEEFFKASARPFTLNDAHSRELKHVQKKLLQSVVETLVRKEKLIMKINGKMNIYCYNFNRDDSKASGASNDKSAEERARYARYVKKISEKEEEMKKLEDELKENTREEERESTVDLQMERDKLRDLVEQYQQRADEMKNKQMDKVDDKELKILVKKYAKSRNEFAKRKRIITNVLNAIMDSTGLSMKKLIEEMDIDTDEASQFDIANFPELGK